MRHIIVSVVTALVVMVVYGLLPVGIIGGWIRWFRGKASWSVSSIFSLLGFSCATASALLAIASILYAHTIGGFPFYDPRLLRIFRWGGLLSLTGVALAICGWWRPNTLRWYAPACAAGALLFWFAMAMGE
jgi:hypothetical protein